MSLLYIDSFDHIDSGDLEEKGYTLTSTNGWTIDPTGGRRGTSALRPASGVGAVTGSNVAQSYTDSDGIVVGFAWSSSFTADNILKILDNGGNELGVFSHTAAGEFKLVSGGVTVTSATSAYTPSAYSYYEVKYLKGTGADATFEMMKDGLVVLSITTSTETAQASAVRFLDASFGVETFMDDLYVLNTLGTTNNDYLGDVRVDAHLADADGVDVDFVPNTGAANYTHVDEKLPDFETTFVEAGTISSRDLHSVDSATLGTVIYGVQPCVLNRKTDAGTVTVDQITEKSGGAGEQVSGQDVSTDDYSYHLAILEQDPDDDVTWTDARINATEFGYKINNIET